MTSCLFLFDVMEGFILVMSVCVCVCVCVCEGLYLVCNVGGWVALASDIILSYLFDGLCVYVCVCGGGGGGGEAVVLLDDLSGSG